MTTLTNASGTKAVNISTDGTGTVRAMYVQIYNGEQQVLDSKSYSSVNMAQKWASKKLS
jgi:hypothetical protein|tara:strand:+ start:2209 stop:2385 length:177 start_codon:yes stop_codon:yes gene_type:complete